MVIIVGGHVELSLLMLMHYQRRASGLALDRRGISATLLGVVVSLPALIITLRLLVQ